MKKLLSLVVVLILAISGAAMAETETKTYVIGATPSPHAELLELIKDDMAALGYPIEIKIFTDYNLPNAAVASGELDANYFAHIPFINAYNASVGEDQQVVPVIGVHYEPFGIYSSKISSLDELPEIDKTQLLTRQQLQIEAEQGTQPNAPTEEPEQEAKEEPEA